MSGFESYIILMAALLTTAQAPAADGATYAGPRENLHVYLLIGQSNMAGRAPVPREDGEIIPGCYLLNDQDLWEPAANPLNRYSTIHKGIKYQRLNPGYSFCTALRRRAPSVAIGLVVNARGGTSIREWARGGRYYAEALRRARKAGETGELKGILWHQGEQDAEDGHYLAKLKQLIADLRADLGDAKLAFVAGQVKDAPVVNGQIARLPAEMPFTAAVSSEGLQTSDRWHFDAASIKILGERYAEAVLKLRGE